MSTSRVHVTEATVRAEVILLQYAEHRFVKFTGDEMGRQSTKCEKCY
jgi:hypothetical protein